MMNTNFSQIKPRFLWVSVAVIFFLAVVLLGCPTDTDDNGDDTVAVTGVTLDQSLLTMRPGGDTATLTATVQPDNADNKAVSWNSSDVAVATVDANGVVTSVSGGQATITVTTTDGGRTATATAGVLSVTELPKSTDTIGTSGFAPDSYRSSFVAFTIVGGGDYKLGLRASSMVAPDAATLAGTTAAITRTLSSDPITTVLSFHIDGTHFNDGVTQSLATAQNTILKESTGYTLYAVAVDSSGDATGSVLELSTFTTDARPTVGQANGGFVASFPINATVTVRVNDLVLFEYYQPTYGASVFLVINDDEKYSCALTTCTGYVGLSGESSGIGFEKFANGGVEIYLSDILTQTDWSSVLFDDGSRTINTSVEYQQ